jgi:hypothetical protein
VVHAKCPFAGDGCLAVPLNLLDRQGEKTSAEEKDYDPGLEEADDLSHTYPVDPERTTPRKLPALLAVFRVVIGCEACASVVGFGLLVP